MQACSRKITFENEVELIQSNGLLAKKAKYQIYDSNNHFLGMGKTSADGKFSPEFFSHATKKITFTVKLIETENKACEIKGVTKETAKKHYRHMKEGYATEEIKCTFKIYNNAIQAQSINLVKIHQPEKVPLTYIAHLAEAVLPAEVYTFKEKAKEIFDFFNTQGAEEIRKSAHIPKVDLTPANAFLFLTQGLCPIYWQIIDNYMVASVNFDEYQFDELKSLANAKLYFEIPKTLEEIPPLLKIETEFRSTLHPSNKPEDHEKKREATPNDSYFLTDLRKSMSAFFIYGQLYYHLLYGHEIPAETSEAVGKDISKDSILGKFIYPFCKYTPKITYEVGIPAISGDSGIMNRSAFSTAPNGIPLFLRNGKASFCPFTFLPRASRGKNDYFANILNHHYYNVITPLVENFFNKNWDTIMKEEWGQIHNMFDRLWRDSPVYRPYEGKPLEEGHWLDTNEIGGHYNPNAPARAKYDKETDEGPRSFRPVAVDKNGPGEHDKEMIMNFFKTHIFLTSPWHSWIHGKQYQNKVAPHVGDSNFTPINMTEYGEGHGANGGIPDEDEIEQSKLYVTFEKFPVHKYSVKESKTVDPTYNELIENSKQVYLDNHMDPDKELTVSTSI